MSNLDCFFGVFLSHIEVQFIAVLGKAVGVGSKYLCLLVSRFLFSIRKANLVPKCALRCFVALAGILPANL